MTMSVVRAAKGLADMKELRRLRIYVAGPYTADTPEGVEANVRRAIDAGIEIMKRGHYPFIPHLAHWMHVQSGEWFSREDWLAWGIAWLRQCDALLRLPRKSIGADREVVRALRRDKFVFGRVEDIPDLRTGHNMKWYGENEAQR